MTLEIHHYHSQGRTALTLDNIAAVDNKDVMDISSSSS